MGGIGEQEAPAQHLLDENVGQSVSARLPGPSAVTSSSGHGRPDQTFITAEREEEMVEGLEGGGGVGGALKMQQAAAEAVWRHRGTSARRRCSGLERISGGSPPRTPRGRIKKSTRRGLL